MSYSLSKKQISHIDSVLKSGEVGKKINMYLVRCKFEISGNEYDTLPEKSRQFHSKLEAIYYATELQEDLRYSKATKVYIVIDEFVRGEWHKLYVLRS